MRYRLIIGTLLLMIVSGCNMDANTTDSQQPTFTPLPNIIPISTESVAANDPTPVIASCGDIISDIQAQRAEVSRTLPNGKPFPGKSPQTIENKGKGHKTKDGRIEVMIQFTPDSAPNERNQYINDIGGTSRRQIDVLNTYVVILNPNSTLESLPESAIVIQAEINSTAVATQITPNDPRYAEQWSLSVIGLPQAWEGISSNAVTIAVIDSGVCSNHPDLQGRIIAGYDFVDEDSDPSDMFGHGCGVAGVIAANSNNSMGIAGTTPSAQIMPLRVLDASGLGNYADISAAIVHAADNGANIINMSLAGTNYSQVMADAIAYAVSRGVQIVASAGNHGSDGVFYPAAYPSVVSVGSIDPDLSHSSFSNYGANVDIWAPGRDILTTSINGDYEFMSGTSFASPLVAGIMALAETSNTTLDSADGIAYVYPENGSTNCS